MHKFLKLEKHNYKYFLFSLFTFISLVIQIIRFVHYDSVPIGYESYFHQRMAASILTGNRSYNPFHLLISGFSLIFGTLNVAKILPLIMGYITLWLLIKFFEKTGMDLIERFIVLLILTTSPVFIYLSSTLNVYLFGLMMVLAGALFYLEDRTIFKNICYLIILLSSFYLGLLISIICLFEYLRDKNKSQFFYFLFVLIFSIASFQIVPYTDAGNNLISSFIGDLGAVLGFNIYALILSIFGLLGLWKHKRMHFQAYGITLILFIISVFFDKRINIFLLLPFSFFAAKGLIHFKNREWNMLLIKDLTMLILLVGFTISTISSIKEVANTGPNNEVYESLTVLKDYANKNEKVFSTYDKSEWIRSIGGAEVVNDFNEPNYELTKQILLPRNLNNLLNLLKENKITYIWIDDDIRERYFDNEEQGLIYFMKNSDNFYNIFQNEYAELWEFSGDSE